MDERLPDLTGRRFLLLQGPQSGFFADLGDMLLRAGAEVHKVNFCGGDVFLWGRRPAYAYRGDIYHWPAWVGDVYRRDRITDVCLYGDWRPRHWEAVRLARVKGIRVWVFEEGYLRNGWSTLEEDGVNGRSMLPATPHEIHEIASCLKERTPQMFENDIRDKVMKAILHHVGNTVLWPWFHHYRTHRPTNIVFELIGILPRYLKRKSRQERSEAVLKRFYGDEKPYYFFPLQLNSDSQIQLYSPYVRIQESIAGVLASFASGAPKDVRLLIRNHPLDNGLINYGDFIESFSKELGIADRVFYVEDGSTPDMVKGSKGVVLVNSTVGLMALEAGKPVYCLGRSVYSMPGLAQSMPMTRLDFFWRDPGEPDETLYRDFRRVLQARALIQGNFYTGRAIHAAAVDSLRRFSEKPIEEESYSDWLRDSTERGLKGHLQ